KPDIALVPRFPRTAEDQRIILRALLTLGLTVPPHETLYYVSRLVTLLSSYDERRLTEYEDLAWWDFCGTPTRSAPYQEFMGKGFTRSLVAIRAEEGSTRTVSTVGLQLFLGLFSHDTDVDRLLCGPTNEVWIDPWIAYLREQSITFH